VSAFPFIFIAYLFILGLHCHAIKQNEKIIRKPFGRKSQEIVLLWEIKKEVTSPSLKSVHFS